MYENNDYRNYLMHHGILGQKWGVRRYQNSDGSLTSKGKTRYKDTKTPKKKMSTKKKVAIGAGIVGGILAATGGVMAYGVVSGAKAIAKKLVPIMLSPMDPVFYAAMYKANKTGESITKYYKPQF